MLNMGGISNFTYLPASMNPEEVFVTDTGTGNTLLDAFTKEYFPHLSFDKDAEIASKGKINGNLLSELKNNNFFRKPFPKTTGPELFNKQFVIEAQQRSSTINMSIENLLATLAMFSAETIAEAINNCIHKANQNIDSFCIYMSGGGMHNPLLVGFLKELLPCKFLKSDDLAIDGNAKEAVLFAVLANETVAGGRSDFGSRKGIPSVSMGKISFPN
jgi:anhydro-N-acetylmuramic acid kinase